MVRFPVFLLLAAAAALPAWAQIQPRSLQTIDDPKGEFSLALRFNTNVDVTFRNVGSLGSYRNIGDQWSELNRSYDDGFVAIDARKASDGSDLADDGRTNTWRMGYANQIVDEDGDGMGDAVAFHRYQTDGMGTTVDFDSTVIPGLDFDYSYAFGRFGGRLRNKSPRATWGAQVGVGLSSINAKYSGPINVNLVVDEDRYSLDGATPPTAPYTAPSTKPSGSNTLDTTVFLANRPYARRTYNREADGDLLLAPVEGFWQVRGGSLTMRTGLWVRYRPFERLGIRAGAGVSATFLGLTMRYDEYLDKEEVLAELRHKSETSPDKWTYFGAYGTLDAEWWLTPSTSLFLGASYEQTSEDISIPLDGRTADVRLGSGTGFRLGFSKLF